MVIHELKCVFVHIPKCAGQSVAVSLMAHLGCHWEDRARFVMRPNRDPSRGPARLAHMTAAEYVQFEYLTREQFDSYFKFSFVRNPWDRIVSEYNWANYHKHFSFEAFLTEHFPVKDHYEIAADHLRHVIPQADFLFDQNDRCMVDFIGRFETLQADFFEICERLGIPRARLPVVNKKAHKPYQHYYNEKTRALVAEKYARDIKLFKYQFDPCSDYGDNIIPA